MGRPVLTDTLAAALHDPRTPEPGLCRGQRPNIKRVIDLVRLLAAAELAKNPGYDVGDVARALGFALVVAPQHHSLRSSAPGRLPWRGCAPSTCSSGSGRAEPLAAPE
jgi:hypothetical protein